MSKYAVTVLYADSDIGSWDEFDTERQAINYKCNVLNKATKDVTVTTYCNDKIIDRSGISDGCQWSDCVCLSKYL